MRITVNGVRVEIGRDIKGWWRIDVGCEVVRFQGSLATALSVAVDRVHAQQSAGPLA